MLSEASAGRGTWDQATRRLGPDTILGKREVKGGEGKGRAKEV